MYCVKCGVRLQDSEERCPLCATPVWKPEESQAGEAKRYSALYPRNQPSERLPVAIFITIVLMAACAACLVFCLNNYEAVAWSDLVMLGVAVFYTCVVLPMWFRKPNPVIFVPAGFAAVCGYLLYLNLDLGGDWFLSFAFPVLMLVAALTTGTIALFRYVGRWKLFITGGLLTAIGGASMLVEFFQHITFGTRMFVWSIYSLSAFAAVGIFLLLAGFVKPLREWLIRRAFL